MSRNDLPKTLRPYTDRIEYVQRGIAYLAAGWIDGTSGYHRTFATKTDMENTRPCFCRRCIEVLAARKPDLSQEFIQQ